MWVHVPLLSTGGARIKINKVPCSCFNMYLPTFALRLSCVTLLHVCQYFQVPSLSRTLSSSSSVVCPCSSWRRRWASTPARVGWPPGGRFAPCLGVRNTAPTDRQLQNCTRVSQLKCGKCMFLIVSEKTQLFARSYIIHWGHVQIPIKREATSTFFKRLVELFSEFSELVLKYGAAIFHLLHKKFSCLVHPLISWRWCKTKVVFAQIHHCSWRDFIFPLQHLKY